MRRARAAVVDGAPDPDDALRRLERIEQATESAGIQLDLTDTALDIVALCCQRAPYLATLLARDPERLARVEGDHYLRREKPASVMATELASTIVRLGATVDELDTALRMYRADEMVRLGVRELEMGNAGEVGHELAYLAEVSFDAAIAFHNAALAERYGPPRYTDADGNERDAYLAVIGMGKLGGHELNFSSDVDVIYVYSSDNGSAGDLSLHEYFSKLCLRVTAALNDVTDNDVVFRVDLRLRPEGSRGAIANSLASTERYYETYGRPWERQAWIKARPSAGDLELGDEIMKALRGFIYPRAILSNIVEDVASLNQRIKAELDSSGVDAGFDLKNGIGGIREIEFFVQAMQLIHGGHQPSIRSRTTLIALDQLMFAGIITDSEHSSLMYAYRYLRHAEHVLQLDSGRQTQRRPVGEREVHVFARRLGHESADEMLATLSEHTTHVARLFATLGAEDDAPDAGVLGLLAGRFDTDKETAVLAELGFRDPARAHRELDLARRKPLSPLGHLASGDPDQALRYVNELISRRGSWSSVWHLFDANPLLMRLLVSLFGTSDYLAKHFVSHPELIDQLVQAGRARSKMTNVELWIAATEMLRAADDDLEARWNLLAEFKNAQVLRIGLADIGGELDPIEVSRELSSVAELSLRCGYDNVSGALSERHGKPRLADGDDVAGLAVLGLGKLGGRELGYASDLDVIFVFSGDGESDGPRPLDNVTYMSRIAQRMMTGLHALHPGGRLYEVDTRLRPDGSRGLLVSSLAGWRKYHAGDARLWERQALIKLRPVAGDQELGAKVAAAAAEHAYDAIPGRDGAPTIAELAQGITSMRDKIEHELAGSSGRDLKAGRGGLIDIEFAAQFLQLAHGHEHAELRTPSTLEALAAAADTGVADPEDCARLSDGYKFLRLLEHRMRIVHDRSVQRLPDEPIELDRLAHRAGYPDGAELTDAYTHWTRDVRATFERVLGHEAQ
jgi:glutamate-ammonia-ligase adenylyltransferase